MIPRQGRRRLPAIVVALFSIAAAAGVPPTAMSAFVAAQRSAWPRQSPPGPLPPRPFVFPKYQIRTLANGLQVVVVLHHEEPAVSFRLIIRAGAVEEPPDRPGVASLTASLLNQGTSTRSSEDIADIVDSAGGVLEVGAGNELSFVAGAVLKDRTDLVLGMAADLVEHPAFANDEIDRQRQQALSALQVQYDDPAYLASAVFDRVVFGLHPYGRPTDGTPASLASLTRDDVVAFHRAWFAPNNALLAIVGDLTADEAFSAAERAFGSWTRKRVPEVAFPPPPEMSRRLVIVDRPDSAQTEIRIGHLGVARTHPDYLPLDLAIHVLGGEGANRLFGVLRTDRGLAYGAEAQMHAFRNGGAIVAESSTRSSATAEALQLMVTEFGRLAREAVDVRELRGVQDYLEGGFPLTIETPSAIGLQVLNQLFYGLDLHGLETYRERVDHVTAADLQRVSKAFIKPDQIAIVLVGEAAQFADQLKALGFGDAERIPLAELDLGSPTLRRRAPGAPGQSIR
jgi:zinc protease